MSTTSIRLNARRLFQAGCRHIFGIPDSEVPDLPHALVTGL